MSDSRLSVAVDTNVLVYLTSPDAKKAQRAREILSLGGVISVQVLNELSNVLRRKMRFSWTETHDVLSSARMFMAVVPVTLAVHESGLDLAERHGFQLYDAMIVAAALDAGCDVLWSEDMQDGMVVDGRLTIRNPFRHGAATVCPS
jgi:predicted nucleic acid-binding protein